MDREAGLERGVDYRDDADSEWERRRDVDSGSNVILLGATGAGKSTTGWLLSRLIGYGFIDLDQAIEARERRPVHAIFETDGEPRFRELEREQLASLRGLRSHVLAVGGGTVSDDENWRQLQEMGTTVWINTPPAEIARRLSASEDELRKRPLLAEVLTQKDAETRHKLLSERLKALIGNRVERYRLARVAVTDSFSTPESTAHLVKDILMREGFLAPPREQRPIDRWRIL